ncbi:AAA family ATPase [Suttonella sp. R2A3]|uniref:AAA family ATPase n=1 Tax=Suttonella sp. R2A3 TaxID=2908648 RepID=UPI001F39B034|nr:AAA family ATPase [Suttonella sp. R2A3]UJF24071.1 AAA family ATPase [Suttonella sp. R2A3]
MSSTLKEIAQQLRNSDKKVQLIYAFNGTGKTRLSREYTELVASRSLESNNNELGYRNILYYNALTEDLFYWDNDSASPLLKIHRNIFTQWMLKDQGLDQEVVNNFQKYVDKNLTPRFNDDFSEVTFTLQHGDDETSDDLKISRGEESNFIWSFFYTLLSEVISVLNKEDERGTSQFDHLEHIFIDDPVSSLDQNHLIELAFNLSEVINSSQSRLKFLITTHNPLFYNVLYKELELNKKGKKEGCYLLERHANGTYELNTKYGDSNKSFSYHLHLIKILKKAISDNEIERYHFILLRNLYEKTASFLGYPKWSELLPDDKNNYYNRIIQFTSHSTLPSETPASPSAPEQQIVNFLLQHLLETYSFWHNME